MDLNLTPEESSFRDELRAWLATNAPTDWAEWREKPLRNLSILARLAAETP